MEFDEDDGPSERIITDKEFAGVRAISAERRVEHAVKEVADFRAVWMCRTASGATGCLQEDGREAPAVWPHEPYAKAEANRFGPESAVVKIEWDEFVGKIALASAILAVFPVDGRAAILTCADFVDRVVAYGREWYGDEDPDDEDDDDDDDE